MGKEAQIGFVPISMGSPSFRSVDIGGFLLTHAWFPPGTVLYPHAHERVVFSVMLDGSFDLRMSGRTQACEPATVFTEPGGERHANYIGSAGAEVIVVQPHPEREFPTECIRMLDGRTCFRDGRIAVLARRMRSELREPDALSPLGIEALALEMLVLAARRDRSVRLPGEAPAWLSRVNDMIHDRFREDLRIADFAREAGVHASHIARVFREHYGASLGSYLRALRLEWAAGRLVESDDSLAAIALNAGFADQSHFTRAFHRHTGMPPGRFRRIRRGRESDLAVTEFEP